jgi:hypothetical protein
MLHTIKIGKSNWIGHILRRNCLLKHTTEGQKERHERRRKQVLEDLMKTRR